MQRMMTGTPDTFVLPEPEGPPSEQLSPAEWVRKRLFSSVGNGVVTLVLGVLTLYFGYRFFRFVLVTGRWEPVRENLELFMIGTFSRDERWRVVGQSLAMAAGIGLFLGNLGASRREAAERTGEPLAKTTWQTYARRFRKSCAK